MKVKMLAAATVAAFALGACTTDPYTGQQKLSNTAGGAALGALAGPKDALAALIASRLAIVEPPLRDVLAGMLAFDPAARPTTMQLETMFRVVTPSSTRNSATRI